MTFSDYFLSLKREKRPEKDMSAHKHHNHRACYSLLPIVKQIEKKNGKTKKKSERRNIYTSAFYQNLSSNDCRHLLINYCEQLCSFNFFWFQFIIINVLFSAPECIHMYYSCVTRLMNIYIYIYPYMYIYIHITYTCIILSLGKQSVFFFQYFYTRSCLCTKRASLTYYQSDLHQHYSKIIIQNTVANM